MTLVIYFFYPDEQDPAVRTRILGTRAASRCRCCTAARRRLSAAEPPGLVDLLMVRSPHSSAETHLCD